MKPRYTLAEVTFIVATLFLIHFATSFLNDKHITALQEQVNTLESINMDLMEYVPEDTYDYSYDVDSRNFDE